MNIKKIATAFLILFVVASVGTIVAKERGAQLALQAEVTPVTETLAAQTVLSTEEQTLSAAPKLGLRPCTMLPWGTAYLKKS